ncbi:MAG TPA: helix-turn-helix domain-containing protein, partial [Umezawaea sp.]|nr:helix-turn-helix domain-containing protein [Umezawaea sp.]
MTADPGRRNRRSWRATLDAAFDLLEEVGYDAITMGAIAERAGVGRQTLYRWWPSKGAVVFEAFLDRVTTGPFRDREPFPEELRRYAHGFRKLYVDTSAGR